MNSKDAYIAGVLVALTLLAWTGAVFFVRSISDAEAARVVEIQDSQQSSTQQSALLRMHAIAQDTEQDRARLDQLLTIDIGSAATILRNVGKMTHTVVTLSGAIPETLPPGASSGPQIHAVGFAVQADGTFNALMRTAELFETLPLASSIERFDIQRGQDSGDSGVGLWHLSVYIRVLTTSNISS